MSIGTFEAAYVITGNGVAFPDSPSATRGEASISATGNGSQLVVTITLRGVLHENASANAQAIAESAYRRILMEFGGDIITSASPQPQHSTFIASTTSEVSHRTMSISMDVSIVNVNPVVISQPPLAGALERALFDHWAPPPVFTAALTTARKMFAVAMETEDTIASYLVCYSALSLFALFKQGRDKKGRSPGQAGVDELLTNEDPTIALCQVRRANGKTYTETQFTEIRNDFVHAEERRGNDPEEATKRIESQLSRFRALTGRILQKG